MNVRDKVKQMAREIQEIENLEDILRKGFIKEIEHFGSLPRNNEFKIATDFHQGSGVSEIRKRMLLAQKRGLLMLENEMVAEANLIIEEFNK